MSVSEIKRFKIGNLIEIFDLKNKEGKSYPFYGINKDKTFMPTVADTNELDNTKYKIVSEVKCIMWQKKAGFQKR